MELTLRRNRFGWRWPAIRWGRTVYGSDYNAFVSFYLGPYRLDVWFNRR